MGQVGLWRLIDELALPVRVGYGQTPCTRDAVPGFVRQHAFESEDGRSQQGGLADAGTAVDGDTVVCV